VGYLIEVLKFRPILPDKKSAGLASIFPVNFEAASLRVCNVKINEG
jgi:hypothetical protein